MSRRAAARHRRSSGPWPKRCAHQGDQASITACHVPSNNLPSLTGIASLGPDPLAPEFTEEVLGSILAAEGRKQLKGVLRHQGTIAGIGNAYSDEILHRARLSPVALTTALDDAAIERLWTATRTTLGDWIARLRRETGTRFPEKVTAVRDGMAVHGRYRQPCPDCGAAVQRIVHAANETNYCPQCQTGGRLLADRALSRLLHADWPRTPGELEERLGAARTA